MSARPEGLDHDVGAGAQLARQGEVARVLEVEDDRALVAVEAQEVRRALVGERRSPGAGVVAGRGRSTLTTSAPRSPSVIVHSGPASTREKSATSRPSRAPGACGASYRPAPCGPSSSPTCTSAPARDGRAAPPAALDALLEA